MQANMCVGINRLNPEQFSMLAPKDGFIRDLYRVRRSNLTRMVNHVVLKKSNPFFHDWAA
jgi:hypothetical protein